MAQHFGAETFSAFNLRSATFNFRFAPVRRMAAIKITI